MSNCDTFQTQVASIMEIVAKSAVAEMSKLVNESSSAELPVEGSGSEDGNEARKMAAASMAQFASSMETLAKDAANKICELASEESAVLRLEMSESQSENGALKRKLELIERELKTSQGKGEGAAGHRESSGHSGLQSPDVVEHGPGSVFVQEETVENNLRNSDTEQGNEISEGEGTSEHSTDAQDRLG
ncbi:hypothetical protein MATL_G00117110 [Megalops atlanticus]|uniref:Uncharacterized protein n=1 Tax=Megalops atlanticus TaxID=7932 RepID=A0A9D3Q1L9_MEGAT|nr:hypothetical protein MATL_G00117110 [Megalops atlanticus]